ncbi:TetR/AcrR family transcriptional regulator [Nocardia sp. NBC_00403]
MWQQQIAGACCTTTIPCYCRGVISTAATSTNKPEIDDSVESRILDAALIQFTKVGVKKTTIEDIARQADVDRVTGSGWERLRAAITQAKPRLPRICPGSGRFRGMGPRTCRAGRTPGARSG